MNFQNIPRQDKTIKRAFLPKLDALCFFDYEQIEYRLLAYYLYEQLGESRMVDNFRAGLDPHTETAKLILDQLGVEYDDPMSDFHRQVGKTANFSIVYAGGKPTIIRQLTRGGWSVDDALAKKILDAVRSTMPEVAALNEEIHARLDERGYIETLWGRQLRPDIKKYGKRDAYRRMLNALIQGCAADLMRHGLRETHKGVAAAGLAAHMVNVVHDEITLDAPADELSTIATLVPRCMDYSEISRVVPVLTSTEVSFESWADKVPYKEV
jgi:DNA polymerase I